MILSKKQNTSAAASEDLIVFSDDIAAAQADTLQDEPDPFAWFRCHYEQAADSQVDKPNAVCLATANKDGRPSARMVLIKEVTRQGFVFYTNYHSRKGEELTDNPHASLVFYWVTLDVQIRVEGKVNQISAQASQAYFSQRSRESQLGAWVSPQSRHIDNVQNLMQQMQSLAQRYKNEDIPLPPHWGGYVITPDRFEFWYSQPGRMHDRFEFKLPSGHSHHWHLARLAP